MSEYSVADAKDRLPRLIDQALAGEEVVITRRGKPVIELRRLVRPSIAKAGTHAWLDARTRARPPVGLSSVEVLEGLYEADAE